ncbi:glycine betaine/L-proline ABC transporter ATP-binding protein [Pseudomonas sp.]|uniref:quaternary amine ABC transporter ATP-binding protein n=1 Tax=Pseudomonas sp. TaxID=306 RepID=UPI00299D0986|nr:glycine betaine/L-proline ABC transporter ATP-binding protein [Pseudomonas sp.]MDX1368192.1 glycine betaine/L-proline ABC transporter ATP-binding protein [Pseudomonas sp.]
MSRAVKVSCKNLWLLFGKKATEFLEAQQSAPSDETIAKAGLVAAVRDVSLDVYEGEILVVMGLSGSGKSTLIRCLTRLIEPSAGEVIFDGEDLLAASARQLTDIRRHKMGMVFQHFGLLPHRTVLENIAFPLELQGIDKQTRLKKARELIETVGLSGREDDFPRQLSGGQQQRVGIARSLVDEPQVWFLDEPFSALDPLIRREMQDEFLHLQAKLNKTIIFVSHDFDEAVRLGNRIAIMKDGRVAQIGTAEELVTAPANDYVEQFVQHAPTARLVTVQKIMAPYSGSDHVQGAILCTDLLQDIAARVINAPHALPVTDTAGQVVGHVDKEQLARVLF